MKSPHLFIGCSGYYYSNWRKNFYNDRPAAKWLEEYSKTFNTVELNGTFYKVPTLDTLRRQAAQTPDDFKFSVKTSRYVTHIRRLNNIKNEVASFEDLLLKGLGTKLENILFQMPPSFHYKPENLEAIRKNIPDSDLNVLEFRHSSWWNKTVFDFFGSQKRVFCNVDFPGLQPDFLNNGKKSYLRLHGVPELFKSPYSEERLNEIADKIIPIPKKLCAYFNNTFYGEAWKNALQLKTILKSKFEHESK